MKQEKNIKIGKFNYYMKTEILYISMVLHIYNCKSVIIITGQVMIIWIIWRTFHVTKRTYNLPCLSPINGQIVHKQKDIIAVGRNVERYSSVTEIDGVWCFMGWLAVIASNKLNAIYYRYIYIYSWPFWSVHINGGQIFILVIFARQ